MNDSKHLKGIYTYTWEDTPEGVICTITYKKTRHAIPIEVTGYGRDDVEACENALEMILKERDNRDIDLACTLSGKDF